MQLSYPLLAFALVVSAHMALLVAAEETGLAILNSDRSQRPSQSHSPQETSLQPRILPLAFPGLGLGIFEPLLIMLLPIVTGLLVAFVTAFVILVRLFSEILDNCLSIWALNPPRNQVVIEAGQLRLEFGCCMQPVPWEFVADFIKSQESAIKRGFAPLFARLWQFDNTDRKRFCYAGLRIVPKGGEVVVPNG